MTRGYVFTLTGVTQNLWTLISAGFADIQFDKTPYVPNLVKQCRFYFPVAGPNSANNAGNNVGILKGTAEIKNLISDGEYIESSDISNINLNNFNLLGSANGVQIEVSITD